MREKYNTNVLKHVSHFRQYFVTDIYIITMYNVFHISYNVTRFNVQSQSSFGTNIKS